jgi:hypothetical protein
MLDYATFTDTGVGVSTLQYLGEDDSGLIILQDASTNGVDTLYAPRSRSTDVSVDATFAYASSHYGDLLRRLAD